METAQTLTCIKVTFGVGKIDDFYIFHKIFVVIYKHQYSQFKIRQNLRGGNIGNSTHPNTHTHTHTYTHTHIMLNI